VFCNLLKQLQLHFYNSDNILLNWFDDDDAHSGGERPDNKEDKEGKGHLNSDLFFLRRKKSSKFQILSQSYKELHRYLDIYVIRSKKICPVHLPIL